MEGSLVCLLNLLKVVATCRSPQLSVLASEEILAQLLDGTELVERQEQLEQAMGAVASGQADTVAGLRLLLDALPTLESISNLIEQRWHNATVALDQLLLINTVLEDPCVLHADLHIETSAVFDYIQSLRFESVGEGPSIVLIGTPASSNGLEVSGDSDLLRRISLTYRRGTSYPSLTVRLPSTTPDAPRQGTRLHWEQRDTPDDDLELYSFNHRSLGRVVTRRATAPYELIGRKIKLIFPKRCDAAFLVTDIIDARNSVLGRYVKLER